MAGNVDTKNHKKSKDFKSYHSCLTESNVSEQRRKKLKVKSDWVLNRSWEDRYLTVCHSMTTLSSLALAKRCPEHDHRTQFTQPAEV